MKKASLFFANPFISVILISCFYWGYLLFHTSMEIKYDGAVYQRYGAAIYEHGVEGFFQQKPINGILYPCLIATAKFISHYINVDSLKVQQAIQLLFLLVTQFLLYLILKKLNISKLLSSATLLYFTFSPGLVNAALSSWSEIMVLPFVLGIIFLSFHSYFAIKNNELNKVFLIGLGLGILFVCASLIREICEIVLILFLFFYFLISISFLINKNLKMFLNSLMLLIVVFTTSQALFFPYKQMNLKYQNEFAITPGKAVDCAYGITFGRTQKLTQNQLLSFLAFIPGDNVVKKVFGEKLYNHWYYDVFEIGVARKKELLSQGLSEVETSKLMFHEMIQTMLQHPIQYSLLTAAEGFKFLFWESTQIGFVNYPSWLSRLFAFTPFKNLLRLVISLLTIVSFYYAIRHVIKNFLKEDQSILILFMLMFILALIIPHAPFINVTRYALPIAPLYLALIGFFCQRILKLK